ncbi:MAG TPA: carboxypeptidase-like regulatory domain-containing protein [Candidatus Bathyarchaeia archaeon]|nr:carboxypeptidase-like regulatory domain-containing protein [Candidatus Bathyarchaeia archaeon]
MAERAGRLILSSFLILFVATILRPTEIRAEVLFETGDFIGTVLDQKGSPVPGVEIFVQDIIHGRPIASAVTDELGAYQISSLGEGEYRLTLDPRSTGFQGQTIVAEISASGSLIVDWRVSFKAPARTIATPAIA